MRHNEEFSAIYTGGYSFVGNSHMLFSYYSALHKAVCYEAQIRWNTVSQKVPQCMKVMNPLLVFIIDDLIRESPNRLCAVAL